MRRERLSQILNRFPDLTIAVIGDFFLDKYLMIDPELSEISLETGLEAYQVVEVRCSPGAAGTISSNLHALRVGEILAVGTVGDDGEGYELCRGLRQRRVSTELLVRTPDRVTPTYTKPMRKEPDGSWVEMNRQDIKNRSITPRKYEDALIENCREAFRRADGVIIMDQVEERNHGVVTDRVREELIELSRTADIPVLADSRARIAAFTQVILKPNVREAAQVVGRSVEDLDDEQRTIIGRELVERTERPVFMTAGEDGIYLFSTTDVTHIPGVPVEGPTDPVGAGDSVSAGIMSSLCAGARWVEAGFIGNLVASITVQQLGTTGTASPHQVLERFEEAWERGVRLDVPDD